MVYGIIKINLGNPYFPLDESNVYSAMHLIAWLVYNFLLSPPQLLKLLVCSQTCQQENEIVSLFIKHQMNYLLFKPIVNFLLNKENPFALIQISYCKML